MINFYRCRHCGNIIMFLEASGMIPHCCGDEMNLMIAGSSDGKLESHTPVITVNKDQVIVSVGEKPHPMTGEHHIEWIVLETNKGMHVRYIDLIDGEAKASFALQKGERVIAAYAYCNLHGLWMSEC